MHLLKAAYVRIVHLLIYTVVVGGAVMIGVFQWREAANKSGLGASDYGQGIVGTAMLALILAGIPIILWAFIAYVGLSWLLLGRVERGPPVITAPPKVEATQRQLKGPSGNHDFID